ncbi:hypothetical protein [Pseudoclavibacter sp. VKM Ac-2888]|uniref:hypothetical protein n=1 Tax=Pseudoclavibacter sp. VKM Ac-2888 TaxID=2783830 RepID=UPI00188D6C47|nr:hypothetical protein [Pseudoclavibacter sp. VKM Ac-2888]MBF4552393.1 hypothetical protein [Pseudoclavibacter sp. VKM Ac-2888]
MSTSTSPWTPTSNPPRANDTAPFKAGTDIRYTDRSAGEGMRCSSAFRLNGNSMLTAEHCNGNSFKTVVGTDVGSRYLPLDSISLDVMLIANKTYSNLMYTGGQYTNSTISATGNYPYYTLPFGVQILLSGTRSGQVSLGYTGNWTQFGYADGCHNLGGEGKRCQVFGANADPDECIGSDSGGPLAVYDPANGRVIPVGIQSATNGDRTDYHKCIATRTMAVTYAYGGATLG